MSLAFIVYLIGQLNAVEVVGVFAALVSTGAVLGVVICGIEVSKNKDGEGDLTRTGRGWSDIKSMWTSILKYTLPIVLVCLLLPSEKTAYKMLAAYGVESIATSDAVSSLAPKSLEFLELTLDRKLSELKSTTQE